MASANEIYQISDDYAVQLAMPKMLPALAHVPPAHVEASFELVIEKITDVIEREQFEESVVEKISVVLRRIFRCSYGTWKKIRKCRSLNMFKKLPDYSAPNVPDTKKIKQMQNIRSTYEFENAVPYLRAVANFR